MRAPRLSKVRVEDVWHAVHHMVQLRIESVNEVWTCACDLQLSPFSRDCIAMPSLLTIQPQCLPSPSFEYDGVTDALMLLGRRTECNLPWRLQFPLLPASPAAALGPWAGGFGGPLIDLERLWTKRGTWSTSYHFAMLNHFDQKLIVRQHWADVSEHLPDSQFGSLMGQRCGAARTDTSTDTRPPRGNLGVLE